MAEERADASEAGEPVDLGAVGVREGDAFDLTIELVTPTDFVVHERQILAEDGTVLWREALLVEQPLELLAARENFPLLACENVPLGEAGFLACARRGS